MQMRSILVKKLDRSVSKELKSQGFLLSFSQRAMHPPLGVLMSLCTSSDVEKKAMVFGLSFMT
jgi:hypothetical protein